MSNDSMAGGGHNWKEEKFHIDTKKSFSFFFFALRVVEH